jgi:hypothetical protein
MALVVVASTATTARTSATTTTGTSTAPRSAGTAVGLRARFVDVQCASSELFPVQSGNSLLGFGRVRHFYKRKPSGASGVAVGDQTDLIDFAVGFKQGSQFRFRGAVGEIANKKLLHGFPFSVSQRETSGFVGGLS